MSAKTFMKKLVSDPPPRYAFEISEAGIAAARVERPPQVGFQPLDPDVLSVSPVRDNVQRMEALAEQVRQLAPRHEKKRQRATLILPDYSVRVSVLDFDAFPSDSQQQLSLVRFRIKKSVPFDVDSASISYFAQPKGARVDVVVAVVPTEILARYEAPFRAAGFHTGLVTTSGLCALELVRGAGVAVLAKLCGRTLTLAVMEGGVLRLLRSIELTIGSVEEVASHLYPTFAYAEDQLGRSPEEVLTCGFGRMSDDLAAEIRQRCVPLRSRYGMPDQFNAGLLGYLERLEELA
jgi:type IV pilus assembly protein PilM